MSASNPSRPPSTPPRDPARSAAHSRSLQSTNPNKGSGLHKELLGGVKKSAIERGVVVDMGKRQRCNPMDMVRFLLAFCCDGDSPDTPRDAQAINERFRDCWKKVVPVANSGEMKEKFGKYKSSSSKGERYMYAPLSDALNCGLERLSEIDVDGLPKFETHMAFVPLDEGVASDRDLEGSMFKPDLALMSFSTACNFRNVEDTEGLTLSEFVSKIPEKSPSTKRPSKAAPIKNAPSENNPHKIAPSSRICWKDNLSAVEVKHDKRTNWPTLGGFTNNAPPIVDDGMDDQLLLSQDPDPVTSSDISQSQTLVASKSDGSKKRTATDAGISAGVPSGGNKRQRLPPSQPLLNQAGIYAGEKLSDSYSNSHTLNLLIKDHFIWISWIDREGVIISSRFSLFEHLPLMLVLLLVLQRFGRRQWGEISELTAEGHSVLLHPVNADGTLGEDEVGVNFYPGDKVYSGWSLLGRATTVVGASGARTEGGDAEDQDEMGDRAAGSVVGEDSQEVEICGADPSNARDAYRKACDDIIKAHDLILKVSWPETSRIPEWRIVAHAQTLGKADKFIRGHVPVAKYGRDLDRYSTKHIRDFLDLQHNKQTGTRTLRLTVMNRLRPIHDLDGEQLWDAFWECFLCHYRLWVNGIYHGDISLNNLMYSVSTTGKPEGVLNDYDLASWDKIPTTNNDRTGTIPFMTLSMLKALVNNRLDERMPRLYRHDAESFIWVLAYITVVSIKYNNCSVKISRPPDLDLWFGEDYRAHLGSKRSLYQEYGREIEVTEPHKRYTITIRTLMEYWVLLQAKLFDLRSTELEVNTPKGALESLIECMGSDVQFTEVKTLLLEAIGTPRVP